MSNDSATPRQGEKRTIPFRANIPAFWDDELYGGCWVFDRPLTQESMRPDAVEKAVNRDHLFDEMRKALGDIANETAATWVSDKARAVLAKIAETET